MKTKLLSHNYYYILLFFLIIAIEVCSGEYGDYADKMVAEVDNGRSTNYCKKQVRYVNVHQEGSSHLSAITYAPTTTDLGSDPHSYESPSWMQFRILLFRMWMQMWRDRVSYNI